MSRPGEKAPQRRKELKRVSEGCIPFLELEVWQGRNRLMKLLLESKSVKGAKKKVAATNTEKPEKSTW